LFLWQRQRIQRRIGGWESSLAHLHAPTLHNGLVTNDVDSTESLYDDFGGEEFFHSLVADFYSRVAKDDILRPMYPESDLQPAERRLRLFLMQYWGGPKTYGDERGHPRLRMRHAPFPVGEAARDRWLLLMKQALDNVAADQGLDPGLQSELWQYLTATANAMLNVPTTIEFGRPAPKNT
jgi:hemoglobin